MKQRVLLLVALGIIAVGLLLVYHPRWNFPGSYSWDTGKYWESEWGRRELANYITGAALLISGVISFMLTLINTIARTSDKTPANGA